MRRSQKRITRHELINHQAHERSRLIIRSGDESFLQQDGLGAAGLRLFGGNRGVEAQFQGVEQALQACAVFVLPVLEGLPGGRLELVEIRQLVLHHAVQLEFLLL